jgi:L-alanine-DL-glutamate epimerase-like enolase superfamily enzyme
MKVYWQKYILRFKFDAGTSRGILKEKVTYFIVISDGAGCTGIGECSLLSGLSPDDHPGFEKQMDRLCAIVQPTDLHTLEYFNSFLDKNIGYKWPAIRMGFETAILDYLNGGDRVIYRNDFIKGEGIRINGLIWMGEKPYMIQQVKEKIKSGYSCIKIKIGAIDFDSELEVLKYIRDQFSVEEMTIRVDANGAFSSENVMSKLKQLEPLKIHSIEQPIATGQWESMHDLCRKSPIPVCLDEELIGDFTLEQKSQLVQSIKPHFLILKPSLLGGFSGTEDWIDIAESNDVGWWITSALESNIGLNAICQFTYGQGVVLEQGLGTGQLFHNNIDSPLEVGQGYIRNNPDKGWDLSILDIQCI